METNSYLSAVGEIKKAILKSRFTAASLVNKELLVLYFYIGKYVSFHTRNKNWGKGAIDQISNLLQQELTGLRGFSATNIKNMRIFFEEWRFLEQSFLANSAVELFDFKEYPQIEIRQLTTDELNSLEIRQTASADLERMIFKIGFSHHREILNKCKTLDERIFYIQKSALEFWSHETLKHHLKNNLYQKTGKFTHNFDTNLPENAFKKKALMAFKEELLLDFINIEDTDEEPNERVLEHSIVLNIKKFIMALGSDFSFIGNQYRLIIEDEEYFIDLLFYNRKIQSLVAIELKKGKFKAEYAGKMNLYLSALDEYIKQPHENPSIGIILCKEKNNKIVEFAFRDTSKPMGVVTYKTYNDLPENYKNILPSTEELKKLM